MRKLIKVRIVWECTFCVRYLETARQLTCYLQYISREMNIWNYFLFFLLSRYFFFFFRFFFLFYSVFLFHFGISFSVFLFFSGENEFLSYYRDLRRHHLAFIFYSFPFSFRNFIRPHSRFVSHGKIPITCFSPGSTPHCFCFRFLLLDSLFSFQFFSCFLLVVSFLQSLVSPRTRKYY